MGDERPLTPGEREEYETDLISFCDRELDLLGDIRGLDVLYAGGASLLWIEGLSQRIGASGSLTALEIEEDKVDEVKRGLPDAELRAPTRVVTGDVFRPSLEPGSFDLAYSAGLFHELDVREAPAMEALGALARLIRPGGRVATSDFVDATPAVQVEEERLQSELLRQTFGRSLYGIGSPERLVALHKGILTDVRWRVTAPHPARHLDRLVLAGDEPPVLDSLPAEDAERFRVLHEALRERVRREGYTRPSTLYVEGTVPG